MITLPTRDLCLPSHIEGAQATIENAAPQLVEMLQQIDPDHPWLSKGVHSAKTCNNVFRILEILGISIDSNNAKLLGFAAYNHDLGRIVQALKDAGQKFSPEMMTLKEHGEYTAQLLREWGVDMLFGTDCWKVLEYLFVHHADPKMPAIPDNPSELQIWKHDMLRVLRVADKFATMVNRTDYYLTPEGIAGQNPLMEKECEKVGRFYLDEAGYINEEALDAFSKRQPFARYLCETYEAYMVNYLAWIFEIDIPEILKSIFKSGFVHKITGYLIAREVPDNQINLVYNEVIDYLQNMGVDTSV